MYSLRTQLLRWRKTREGLSWTAHAIYAVMHPHNEGPCLLNLCMSVRDIYVGNIIDSI